jgi:beta-lactamase regulating signal transducer with metallopeptidase domain
METMTMPDLFDPPRISEIWMTGMRAALIHGTIALLFVTAFVTVFRNRMSHSFAHGAFLLVPSKAILAAIFAISSTTVPVDVPVPAEWFELGTGNDNNPAMVSSIPGEAPSVTHVASREESLPVDFDDRRTVVVNSPPDIAGGDSLEQTIVQADGPELSSESRTVLRSLSPLVSCCFIWMAVVMILTMRWTLVSQRFSRSVRRTSHPSSESTIAMVIAQSSQIGLRHVPRSVTTPAVASPAVFGLIRPTLLIPEGFESAFDECEMRWAIAHELAHLKRRDLWAVAFERAVGLAGFFHPALWISRRATANFREQACDDFACRVTGLPPRACAETFLKILVWADRRPAFVQGSPLVLGLNPRYPAIRRRIENMTDTSNTKRHARLGVKSAVSLIVLTAFAAIPFAPKLVAMSPVQAEPRNEASNEQKSPKDSKSGVLLTLKEATTGQPVVDAEVLSFVDNTRTIQHTGKNGQVSIGLDRDRNRSFSILVRHPDFVPLNEYWTNYGLNEYPPPNEIERTLVRGTRIGGRVTDMAGKPVSGAELKVEFESETDDVGLSSPYVSLKTDSEGRWTTSSIDPKADKVKIQVRHPEYVMERKATLRGSQLEYRKPFRELVDRSDVIKVVPGQNLTVRISDRNGMPVEGVHAYLNNITGLLEDSGTVSNADGLLIVKNIAVPFTFGTYSLRVIFHKPNVGWHVVNLAENEIETPLNVRLEPSGHLRLKVIDSDGNPITGARVWSEFLPAESVAKSNPSTNDAGLFESNDFPTGKWRISVNKSGFEGESVEVLASRKGDVSIVLKRETVVEGTVTDAATGEPLKTFRIYQVNGEGDDRSQLTIGKNLMVGRFHQTWFHELKGDAGREMKTRIRIEADGYEPFESVPFLLSNPPAKLDIAMKKGEKGQFVTGKVLKPDGTPATGAEVAFFTPPIDGVRKFEPRIADGRITMIWLHTGEHMQRSFRRDVIRTEPDGTFRLPIEAERIGVVVTHESGGFRATNAGPVPKEPLEVKLQPFGKVEGQLLFDGKPSKEIAFSYEYEYDDLRQTLSRSMPIQVVTDDQGRFVVENVVPGKIRFRYPTSPDNRNGIRNGAMVAITTGATTKTRVNITDFGFEEVVLDENDKATSKFVQGDKEQIFRVSGYAKDADSGQPVTPVMSGLVTGLEGDDISINSFGGRSREGAFQDEHVWSKRPKAEVDKIDPYLVVFANGYETFVSPQRIKRINSTVRMDVKLKKVDAAKMKTYTGTIMQGDGSPAYGAKITSTVVDPGIKVGDSIFRWRLNDHQAHEVDNTGKFEIVSPRELDTLFVKDDSGYAILKASDAVSPNKPETKLTQWARIEGKVKFAGKPIEKLALTLSYEGVALPSDQARANVKIDRDGNFVVPQALARLATLSIYDTSVEGKSRLTKSVTVDTKPGETARTEVLIEGDAAAPDSKPLEKTKNDVSKAVSQLEQAPKPIPSGNAVKQSKPEFPAATGKFIVGRVLKPDGTPAIGAEVGFYTSQDDRNGRFLPRMNREGRVDAIEHKAIVRGERRDSEREPVRTDADGKFRLPVWAEMFGWFVTHDSGSLRSTQLAGVPEGETELRLQPFGRIEGRLLIDGEPANQMFVQIHMRTAANSPEELQGESRRTQTDAEGRFVFDRVASGPHQLRYPDMSDNVEDWATIPQEIVMKAGETIRSEVSLSKHGWEERLLNDQGAIVSRKGHGSFAPGFRVYGQVIDADTGEPVHPVFAQLTTGEKGDYDTISNPGFQRSLFGIDHILTRKSAEEAKKIDPYIVVSSPLYEPYVSQNPIRHGDEPVRHDVRLKKLPPDKLQKFEGQVLDPSGNPPHVVTVWHDLPMDSVPVGSSQFRWKFMSTYPIIVPKDGRFQFTDPKVDGKLMFASHTGVAVVDRSEFPKLPGGVVRLREWGKVRLKFKNDGQIVPNFGFSMNAEEGWKLSNIPSSSRYPQSDGSYLLDRVPPIPIVISVTDRSNPKQEIGIKRFTLNPKQGETIDVDIEITDEELQKSQARQQAE